MKRKFIYLFFFLGVSLSVYWHNVPKKLTKEDKAYLVKLIPELEESVANSLSFDDQIALIQYIQNTLQKNIYLGNPIPYSQPREPKNLYYNESALCYDYSRSIEKALIFAGFKTRHLSIYISKTKQSSLRKILSKQSYSHAISEVETKKGWLIVDSNYSWISLDTDNNPIDAHELKSSEEIIWKIDFPEGYENFYNKKSAFFYGLYSRHGKFYPPYNFIPDYNVRELFYNFF
jgi:hypothetical protein